MEEKQKTQKLSSAFTRVIGKTTLNVVNARQNTAPKSVKSKWCVLELKGKTVKVVSQGDKKYPQIDALRAREIELKAAAQES
jgi:hypothetical protein